MGEKHTPADPLGLEGGGGDSSPSGAPYAFAKDKEGIMLFAPSHQPTIWRSVAGVFAISVLPSAVLNRVTLFYVYNAHIFLGNIATTN